MALLAYIAKRRMRTIATVMAGVFFLVLVAGRSTRPVSFLRMSVTRMFAPLISAGRYTAGILTGVPTERVRQLAEDSRMLAVSLAEREILKKENESLKRLLGVQDDATMPTIGARVRAYTHVLGVETLLIDAGADRGVAAGDIVIDEHRMLVGQVTETATGSATVSVASNPGATFSAELIPMGGKVLIKGLGGRGLALELIPYDTPLRDGDFVLWADESRSQGIGTRVFVGRVVKGVSSATGAFKTGRAVLLADPSDLGTVLVLTNR